MEVTVNVDSFGEDIGMEVGCFKPILCLLTLFVIFHQLHTIVVGLGVAVEIATTLGYMPCFGKDVVGSEMLMN